MRLTIKVGLLRGWLVLLAFCLNAQAWAAPDYVTAWPKQVPVEKPDPVLGDKPSWEYWVYGEAFAKRFKGFPVEKADPELKDGLRAMVLRIYKRNLWSEVNPSYPEQYACEVDLYFIDSVVLPLSESGKPRRIFLAYPEGVSESFKRLDPIGEKDAQAIRSSKPVQFNLKTQPLIFADRPLDGRYSSFGVREYHPNLAPGLSFVSLPASLFCGVAAPKPESGIHWLSLAGNRPYDKDDKNSTLWRGMAGSWGTRVNTPAFDPGPAPESKGYFRVSEAFNKAALPKVTLVKVLNWCINQRYARDTRPIHIKGMSDEAWQSFDARCRATEEHGVIDPTTYPGKAATGNTGF